MRTTFAFRTHEGDLSMQGCHTHDAERSCSHVLAKQQFSLAKEHSHVCRLRYQRRNTNRKGFLLGKHIAVLAEDNNWHSRHQSLKCASGFNATHDWHRQVHHDQVGIQLLCLLNRLSTVFSFAADLKVRIREHLTESMTQ